MISEEENKLLIRTNRGTPCGALMRGSWQPAALSEELTADKPLAVTLFGEELILFRDERGTPALIGRYCAHQGMDMVYGRVERDGLRCLYHGWLFDGCGKVVVRGEWFPGGEQRMEVGQPAYPCTESNGIIFTYMGAGEPATLRAHQLFAEPAPGVGRTKIRRPENYLQGILNAEEMASNTVRFVVPNVVIFPGSSSGAESSVRWHVPVDDHSHVEFTLQYAELSITGDPMNAAQRVLVDAIKNLGVSGGIDPNQA